MNLGLEASGPLSQLGLLREFGADLEPRLVLWLFLHDNDLGDLEREAESPVLRRYLESGFRQDLKRYQVNYQMHMYKNAHHGFHNDSTSRYDEANAALAWDRTLAFFAKHLT